MSGKRDFSLSPDTLPLTLGLEVPPSKRLRHRLEGIDPQWREVAGEMSVHVLYLDLHGNQIGHDTFTNRGISSGWDPDPGKSTFLHRRESVVAPAGASRLRLIFSSAGAPTALGVFLVDDIRVTSLSPDGKPSELKLDYQGVWSEQEENSPWGRSGLRPSMATLLPVDQEGLETDVLALIDDDPEAHADWQLDLDAAPAIAPGEGLLVEWNEMFSIGSSGRQTVVYPTLSPGTYRLVAEELDVFGQPGGGESSITLTVPRPFWKRPWALLLASLGLVGLVLALTRMVLKWKVRQQLEIMKREGQLAQERLRIARDLHDDLGARITQLSLASAMAESDAGSNPDRERFREITEMTRALVSSLHETVWTVNPEYDDLEALVSFLCQLTENLCKPARIRCRIRVGPIPADRPLHSETRHHVILALKEAVNNAIKHSGASEIELKIDYQSPRLHISLSDDGKGFDPVLAKPGNGLDNMRRRLAALGGDLTLVQMDPGLRIEFVVPVS